MNALINKLQRKLGRYAVKNLSLVLIICYMIGYVISFSGISVGGQSLLNYLTLNPYEILHGQVWRLVFYPDHAVFLLFHRDSPGEDLGSVPV